MPATRPIRSKKLPQATFDKYDYYQRAVQAPSNTCDLLLEIYQTKNPKRMPRIIREDFAGTFANSQAWVKKSPHNVAIAVDYDSGPLEYGEKRAAQGLTDEEQQRLTVYEADVRYSKFPPADMIYAFNYSTGYLLNRPLLKDYLKKCLGKLRRHGVVVIDCLIDVEDPARRERKAEGFTYVWHRQAFDTLTRHARFAIHFQLPGEPPHLDQFVYDWRMWTPAEINDLMVEVGFAEIIFYCDPKNLSHPRLVHIAGRR